MASILNGASLARPAAAYALAMMCLGAFSGCGNDMGGGPPIVGPSDSLVVDPTALSFPAVGGAQAKSITVYNGATGGAVSESDECGSSGTRIVSVGAPTSSSGALVYTVAPQTAGTCTLTFSNAAGATGTLTVTVAM